jgi:hypothetical protein
MLTLVLSESFSSLLQNTLQTCASFGSAFPTHWSSQNEWDALSLLNADWRQTDSTRDQLKTSALVRLPHVQRPSMRRGLRGYAG